MKNLIFAILILTCGLCQCSRGEHLANADAISRTELKDTANGDVERVSTDDTLKDRSENGNSADSSKAFLFIRKFYEEYLVAFENDYADSLRRKYCTPALIEKLEKKQLDYDPFLNAQDSDSNLLKTLAIKKGNDPVGYYIISYIEGFEHKKVYIVISLKEVNGGYKINDVITGLEAARAK